MVAWGESAHTNIRQSPRHCRESVNHSDVFFERIRGSGRLLVYLHPASRRPDGHTASLAPGDPVLQVTNADVALTGMYQGRRRVTLTYPVLDRAGTPRSSFRSVDCLLPTGKPASILPQAEAAAESIGIVAMPAAGWQFGEAFRIAAAQNHVISLQAMLQ